MVALRTVKVQKEKRGSKKFFLPRILLLAATAAAPAEIFS
jgi:hypothetical protein